MNILVGRLGWQTSTAPPSGPRWIIAGPNPPFPCALSGQEGGVSYNLHSEQPPVGVVMAGKTSFIKPFRLQRFSSSFRRSPDKIGCYRRIARQGLAEQPRRTHGNSVGVVSAFAAVFAPCCRTACPRHGSHPCPRRGRTSRAGWWCCRGWVKRLAAFRSDRRCTATAPIGEWDLLTLPPVSPRSGMVGHHRRGSGGMRVETRLIDGPRAGAWDRFAAPSVLGEQGGYPHVSSRQLWV